MELQLPLLIPDFKGDTFTTDNEMLSILVEMGEQKIGNWN